MSRKPKTHPVDDDNPEWTADEAAAARRLPELPATLQAKLRGRPAGLCSFLLLRPDQQDDSAYRVDGSPSEPPDCDHVASKQEVGHGAEQGSVPKGAVDAGVFRSIRLGAAV